MLKRAGIFTAAVFLLLTAVAMGQDDGHFDAGLSGAANFTSQTSANGVTQGATNGAGYFASFRLRFNPKHSIVVDFGHSKNSQTYQVAGDFHVLDGITEYTAGYMFSPLKTKKIEPFVLVGGGWLGFHPYSTWDYLPNLPNDIPDRIPVNFNAVKEKQLAFLYGVGLDYPLPIYRRLALRVQYRGLLYKAPDFKVDATSGTSVSLFTGGKQNMAEPSIGLMFRF